MRATVLLATTCHSSFSPSPSPAPLMSPLSKAVTLTLQLLSGPHSAATKAARSAFESIDRQRPGFGESAPPISDAASTKTCGDQKLTLKLMP